MANTDKQTRRSETPASLPKADPFHEDLPTMVNEHGGKQSQIPGRFDLIPPEALALVAIVLHEGAEKYGENNWKLIDDASHLNHAIRHAFAYLASGEQHHLSHAACRILFALHVSIKGVDIHAGS